MFYLLPILDIVAGSHHRAVEGFFSAPQERADYTSFEGGNKSSASAEGYYIFVVRTCARTCPKRELNGSTIAFASMVKLLWKLEATVSHQAISDAADPSHGGLDSRLNRASNSRLTANRKIVLNKIVD
jgi:hypothetical protein